MTQGSCHQVQWAQIPVSSFRCCGRSAERARDNREERMLARLPILNINHLRLIEDKYKVGESGQQDISGNKVNCSIILTSGWDLLSPDSYKRWGPWHIFLGQELCATYTPIYASRHPQWKPGVLREEKEDISGHVAILYYSSSFYEIDNTPGSRRRTWWWTGMLPQPRTGRRGRGKMKLNQYSNITF